MVESLLVELASFIDVLCWEWQKRTWVEWVVLSGALLFLLEVPRYYGSLVLLGIAEWSGLPRRDRRAQALLLQRCPLVSVIVAGRNEGATIDLAVRSLLDQDYPNLEILVIDDASDDDTLIKLRPFADNPRVRVIPSRGLQGRGGRPSATNLGLSLARGEFVVSLDADTTFDRRLVRHAVAAFADPRVGVVAGNVLVRNTTKNLLTRMQTLEYAISIDLHKRWTNLFGCTLQASGAFGAFRRQAVIDAGGWDPELAEDTDVSLRMTQLGWKLAFVPEAMCWTDVPDRWSVLSRQRFRWDRGGYRTYFRKHFRRFRPSVSGWSFATELWSEFFFNVLATAAYPIYLLCMAWWSPALLLVTLTLAALVNCICSVMSLFAVQHITRVIEKPWRNLWFAAIALPFYKGMLRWVRLRALILESLRLRYEDTFLPTSAWSHAPRH